MIERGDIVEATFRPRNTDDLKPGATELIGRRLRFEAMWRITPEDGGDYVGEFAMWFVGRPQGHGVLFAWVPSGDLEDIAIVDSSRRF